VDFISAMLYDFIGDFMPAGTGTFTRGVTMTGNCSSESSASN